MAKNVGFHRLIVFSLSVLFVVTAGCADRESLREDKVVVWHWMTDRKDAFDDLAKTYKEQTGLTVEFKLFFPPGIYSQKVIAAARAENLPEIFGILGEKKTVASFIKAGHILNLSPYMEDNEAAWRDRFYPKTLELVGFKDGNNYDTPEGIYGVPIDTTVMQFVYNKSLLEQAGLPSDKYPQTFDEFVSYAKKIKQSQGVVGFVCGWGEGWMLNALATEWAMNIMGEVKFLRTIEGKVLYTDKDWLKVFSLFRALREADILVSNVATMTNKESEDAFARGKAAFSFNGSWSVNVYKQLNPDLDYGFFSLPKVSVRHPVKVWGGAGSSFMVNSKSPRQEEAVKFLDWLTKKEQQKFLILKTNNLPAIKGCEGSLPSVLKNLLGVFETLTHPDTWPYNEDSRVIEVMNRGLQQIVMGLKSPEDVALEIQDKKEKVSRR